MVFQPHPSELWNCRHFWYGNWTANWICEYGTANLRDFTPLFSGHVEKMKYLVNTDISAMQLFDLRWNARGNTGRVLFLITEYLYKLYLDVNDGCRVLVSSCTWKVSDFRKSRCDDEFFVKQRHPTKPNQSREKKTSNPDNFIHKPSTASLWH